MPVSGELLQELRRYRLAHDLPALPARADDLPLLLPFRGPPRALSRSAVHDAIKAIFADAAAWLRSRGPAFADRADELGRASAHWLRHYMPFRIMSCNLVMAHFSGQTGDAV